MAISARRGIETVWPMRFLTGTGRRRLGGAPERREEPAHGVGFGHRVEDPPRAAAAGTHQDLKPEHPLEQPRPGPPPRDARLRSRGLRWNLTSTFCAQGPDEKRVGPARLLLGYCTVRL
jgi:hypothetical protein